MTFLSPARIRVRALPLAWMALLVTGAAQADTIPRVWFPDFVTLSKQVRPAVVHISPTPSVRQRSIPRPAPGPFGGEDPFNDLWRRFFGERFPGSPAPSPSPGPHRGLGVGSGFIVDPDGYIVTNDHVVEDGHDLTVQLSDGSEYQARVAGRDPKSDIALIKIDSDRKLPVAALGDSAALEVGEWVLAIGNPFGLEQTVTSGIVSAKGRRIRSGPYHDFIQTDASINPGNSGGPLVNLKGEVVGVNTLIYSRTGGSVGIGFAIPINMVKGLLPQLRDEGRVTRGWLGVVIEDVDAETAKALGMGEAQGALVANVEKGSPADAAGVRVGDVIVGFEGTPVEKSGDLSRIVARTPVGTVAQVMVVRDGRPVALPVRIGRLGNDEVPVLMTGGGELGLTVRETAPGSSRAWGGTAREGKGVVVTEVEPGSPGGQAGIRVGDLILEINRKQIDGLGDFRRAAGALEKGGRVLFLIRREDTTIFLALRLPG